MWRGLLVIAGLLLGAGGSQHPSAPSDLSFQDNLAVMMEDDAWVPSHAVMAVGGVLLAVALVLIRRDRHWPAAARLLPFAVVAAVAYAVELVVHTVAFVDSEELAAGETPPITAAHLGMSALAYPLIGIAIALLAWRLARSAGPLLRVLAVIGIVGGTAQALAVPLAIITQENTFDFLFPIGGVGIAVWVLAVGLIGARSSVTPARAAAS